MKNPSRFQWKTRKRILRYLAKTLDHGIVAGFVEPIVRKESYVESRITAHCDSDGDGDVSDRKSTGSYLLLFNGGAISCKSY